MSTSSAGSRRSALRQRTATSSPSLDAGDDRREERDVVAMYLRDIGRYDRLTRAEEVELSRRALAGDTEAQDRLVNCNLRLVVSICKEFTRNNFSLLELVSVGNEGLIVASRKFDGSKGVPFGNYAAHWVKQRVLKYIAENGAHVRIPPYRAAIHNQVVRVKGKLMQILGREPHADEVLVQLNSEIAAKAAKKPAGAKVPKPVTLAEVEEVMRTLQPALELDAPLTEESDASTFGTYFGETPAEANERLEEDLERIDQQRAIADALTNLSERSRQVVVWFFGLEGPAQDLERIAARLGVTRERARQIKMGALKELAASGALGQFAN